MKNSEINLRNGFTLTHEFIEVIRLFLQKEADPTSAVEYFYQGIVLIHAQRNEVNEVPRRNEVAYMELLPFFLTEKCLNYNGHKGTALHALVNHEWGNLSCDLPSELFEQYEEVMATVAEINPALCEMIDDKGATALHILIDGVSEMGWQNCHKLVNHVRSTSNIDIQDNYGESVLHKLTRRVSEIGLEAFFELFNCLKSTSNINLQDKKGRTILHILAERVSKIDPEDFLHLVKHLKPSCDIDISDEDDQTVMHVLACAILQYPEVGQKLTQAFSDLAGENLYVEDKNGMTPCQWISAGKKLWQTAEWSTKMFSEIEDILLTKGKDIDTPQAGERFLVVLKQTITDLKDIDDLDAKADQILDMLDNYGSTILNADPDVFLEMVKKAHRLIESPSYHDIIKEMTNICVETDSRPKSGLLQDLLSQINLKPPEDNREPIEKFNDPGEDYSLEFFVHQDLFLDLVKEILQVDGSTESRTNCLRVLIMNANYKSRPMGELLYHKKAPFVSDCFEWTDKFVDTLTDLLAKGADPEWTPKKDKFVDTMTDLLAQEADPKWIPKYEDESALDYFLQKGNLHYLLNHCAIQSSTEFISLFLPEGYLDHTKLNGPVKFVHYLFGYQWDKLSKRELDISLMNYEDMVSNIVEAKPAILEMTDHNGQTTLHLAARSVYMHPKLFIKMDRALEDSLLRVFTLLTRNIHVNTTDKNSLTPYTWILAGKLQENYSKSNTKIFSQIEKIFLSKGADVNGARMVLHIPLCSKLKAIIAALEEDKDLDLQEKEILQLLTEYGSAILSRDPYIFLKTVGKAHFLIGSSFYLEIVQRMAEIYKVIPFKSRDGVLERLVEQMRKKRHMKNFTNHQDNLMSLVVILMDTDNSQDSRTSCLEILLENSELMSSRNELVVSQYFMNIHKSYPTSALNLVFRSIPSIYAHRNDNVSKLEELLPYLLDENCLSHRGPEGTALHALVKYDWENLPEDLPWDFLQKYKGIITMVTEANCTLLDLTDADGRNPLQCFISGITKHKGLLSIVDDIVPALKTENNINTMDERDKTVLHILAEKVLLIDIDMFVGLVNCLKSSSNIDVQDIYGKNVLHILAARVSEIGKEPFLKLVNCLKTPCNIDEPNGEGQTLLPILAGRVSEIGHEAFLELMNSLKMISHKDIQDDIGKTVLHILADDIAQIGHEEFAKLAEHLKSPSNIDAKDLNDQTVLHILAENIEMIGHEAFKKLANFLRSPKNIDMQDVEGRTVLHILAENIETVSLELFVKLAYDLKSAENINMQNKKGKNILHFMAKTIDEYPEQALESHFQQLTTKENVNCCDCNKVTPYSWILASKARWKSAQPEAYKKLCAIEEIFLKRGAKADLARYGKIMLINMKELIQNLKGQEDLDEGGQEILDTLEEDGENILKAYKEMFLDMIQKAHSLIGAYFYLEIIQKMADLSKAKKKVVTWPDVKLLECLLSQMNEESNMSEFIWYQEEFLSLIEILLTSCDSPATRTKIMSILLMNAHHISQKEERFKWTDQLLRTLRLLSIKRSEPEWKPEDYGYDGPAVYNFVQENSGTALFNFLQRITMILAHDHHLSSQLMELLPVLLTKECLNHKEPYNPVSALHALVMFDWGNLPPNLPEDFLGQYKTIISKVVRANPGLSDMSDNNGRCPLQCVICYAKKHDNLLSVVRDVVHVLTTKNNVNAKDKKGQTVLHLLANVKSISEMDKEESMALVKCVTSPSNIDIKDLNDQTPLHLFAGRILEFSRDTFFEFVNCLSSSSSIDIQDKNERTVLHILASQISGSGAEAFCKLVKCLKSPSNIDKQDNKGQTVLHILAARASQIDQEIFPELVNCLKSPSNIDIQDENGQTALHVLAETATHLGHKSFIEHVNALKSPANINVQDKNGCTVLHIFTQRVLETSEEGFIELVMCLRSASNIHIQDTNGQTVLHKLSESLPQIDNKTFLQIAHFIKSLSNIKVQDAKQQTAFHIVAKSICDADQTGFYELANFLRSASNVEVQDMGGRTVLHILARALHKYPKLGTEFLSVFPLIITTKNVNAKDNDSITPISWVLSGIAKSQKGEEGIYKIFCEAKETFVSGGANADQAQLDLSFVIARELKEVLAHIQTAEDMDIHGQEILDLLSEGGENVLANLHEDFHKIVQEAKHLIKSSYYPKIFQVIVDIYKKMDRKPPVEPFQQLIDQVGSLCEYQDNLLSLIQIIITADDSDLFRSKCLRALILNATMVYIPGFLQWSNDLRLQWTDQFIEILRLLLEKGADPTWIPHDYSFRAPESLHFGTLSPQTVGYLDESALSYFLNSVIFIIADKKHPSHAVMKLLPWFLTKDCLSQVKKNGKTTVLHVLLTCDWKMFPSNLPAHFFEGYREIIRTVVGDNPAFLDMTDAFGRSPLQCFFSGMTKHPDLLQIANEVIPLLKTEKNVKAQNGLQKTVIHILAEKVAQIGTDTFIELFNQTKSELSPDIQDGNGETVLHILAKASFYYEQVGLGLLTVFPLITTEKNVNIFDNNSVTPFSWILAAKAVWSISDYNQEVFTEIEKLFKDKGGKVEVAKPGLILPAFVWANAILADKDCTPDKLQRLLKIMGTEQDWKSCTRIITFNSEVWRNLWKIAHPEFIPIVSDIMRILTANKSICQQAWSLMVPTHMSPAAIPLSVMEILCLCVKNGACSRLFSLPAQTNLPSILQQKTYEELIIPSHVTRNNELTETYMQFLLALHQNDHFTSDLHFLGELYVVSQRMLQLGRKLASAALQPSRGSLESEKWINHFLSICVPREPAKIIPLEDNAVEDSFRENWLQRNPLHLAVILLRYEKSTQFLLLSTVAKYIHETDIHGCTPLHLAYLHHNKHAVNFLLLHGAQEDVTDHFGVTPKSLGSRVGMVLKDGKPETVCYNSEEGSDITDEHPNVKHYEMCHSALEAECGVLAKMKPILILNETEAQALMHELKTLFERLVRGTNYRRSRIVIAGSVKESLKVGRLDKAVVQLHFEGAKWKDENFLEKLIPTLIIRLAEISWKGIYLRPISVHGPWKFLREGDSSLKGVTVSVDIMPVIVYWKQEQGGYKVQGELLEGGKLHRAMEYAMLEAWNLPNQQFKEAYFAYEMDILDNLPGSRRLAIVIAKALLQAYDLCRGDRLRVKMPITSNMVKTALFYILAYSSGQLKIEQEVLRKALGSVASTVETRPSKFKFHPNATPKWISKEDLDQHGEDARDKAGKIFSLIKCLAEESGPLAGQRWKLGSYWNRQFSLEAINGFGEARYILEVCDYALERLSPSVFY